MYDHCKFIDPGMDLSKAIEGRHDLVLVSLSVAVIFVAAYGALTLASRLSLMERSRQRRNWITLGALAMGGGIWTMHFIGMLSFKLPIAVGYDLSWTIVSFFPAVIASVVFLSIISRDNLERSHLIAGGLLMGAGIGIMHYIGMGAMRGDFIMAYEPWLFILSIFVAVILAMLALMVRQTISRWEGKAKRHWSVLGGALVLGGAVAAMHYTAMAAAHFWIQPRSMIYGMGGIVLTDPVVLGSIVSITAALVTAVAIVSASTEIYWRNSLLLTREVETRSKAEASLQEKNRVLEQLISDQESFAYIASHDLREPLRAISSHLVLLERQISARLSPEERASLSYAVDGAKRLDRMVLDLLLYSQIGHAGKEAGYVDVAAAVNAAMEINAEQIAKSSAIVDVVGDFPIIPGNKPDIVRLFSNLIDNAIKFRSPERRPNLRIWEEHDDHSWRFHVEDNGIGIANQYDYHQRIFRIFHRLHLRTEFGGGSGVGLAICKKIAENHGGRIDVHSRGKDQGSDFVVTLMAE